MGIKKRGLILSTCSIIFWPLIVPITLFGSELWVLSVQDLHDIDSFQRQIGRQIQRFHNRSPPHTCIRSPGWMRLETFIYANKVLFLRTILCMNDDTVHNRLLAQRLRRFLEDRDKASLIEWYSPLYNIFKVTVMFGMKDMTLHMMNGTHYYSK